jgi:hypothetical protein
MEFDERDRPRSISRSMVWIRATPELAQSIPPEAVRKLILLEIDSDIESLEAELKKLKAMRTIISSGPKPKR